MKKLGLLIITCIIITLFPTIASAKETEKVVYDFIGCYSEDMAVAGVWSGEWEYGYIDSKANIQIKPKFRDASAFVSGVAAVGVCESGKAIKYGYIDKKGEYTVKPKFDEARDFHTIPNTKIEVAIVGIGEDKASRKYGLIKKDGTYFTTPQFDYIEEYSNQSSSCEFTTVYNKKDGKEFYGVLDSTGKLVVDTKYSYISISNYEVQSGFISININSLYGLYDIKRSKVVEPEYSYVLILEDGVKTFKRIDGKEMSGVYLTNGVVVEPKYDRLSSWNSEEILYETELNGKYGLLGKNGTEVLEPIYDEIRDNGDFQYATLNGKISLITENGKFINNLQFEFINHMSMFNLLEVQVNGKKGLWDMSTGQYLVEPLYDEIYYFEDGYAKVQLNSKNGIIDRSGKIILEPVYDYIYTKYYLHKIKTKNADGSYSYQDDKSEAPVVKVKKDGKEFYLNNDFTPRIDGEESAVGNFDSIGDFEDGVARVNKGDKVGYVKEDLSYVVEAVYDGAFRARKIVDGTEVYYDYFHVQKGDKWGVVFMDGSVIEPISERICSVGENIAGVQINGKMRYINKKNKFLNNEEYESVSPFSEGVGLVQNELLEEYFIDTNGKRVSEIYKGGSSYSEGLAYVTTSSGGKYIDHDGKIVIGEDMHIYHGYPFKDNVAIIGLSDDGKVLYGVMKKDATWLVKPMFDKVEIKDEEYILYLNGKEAEVTSKGKIIWK